MEQNRIARCRTLALSFALILPSVAVVAAPKVNGRLEKVGPFRLLRVWGTPEEMGFAHGFLLGKEIVEDINASVAQRPAEARAQYDQQLRSLRPAIQLPDRLAVEIQAMFEGLGAAGGAPPTIEAAGRAVTVDDLVLRNAGDLLRAFGCSGFTVWGDRAGDAGVITTRNFDFTLLTPSMLDRQLIVVRQPVGRRQVAIITWPGFLGAVTAINEDGVCTFMHDGTGERIRTPAARYTPVSLAMMQLLEDVEVPQAHGRFEAGLKAVTPYPFSYLFRVVTPRVPGSNAAPERTFHVDAGGLGENPPGAYQCITTNHYVSANAEPAANAGAGSLRRYKELEGRIREQVRPQAAWEALKAVAVSGDGDGTLYSLVVYPEQRRLDLAFARQQNRRVIAATDAKPTPITFDQLFGAKPKHP